MADHLTTIREACAEVLRHDEEAKVPAGAEEIEALRKMRPGAQRDKHYRTAAPACARLIDEWAPAIDGTLKRYGDALPLQVKERLEELLADGVRTLDGLPGDRPLSPREQRLVQALEHYADEATWHDSDTGGDVYHDPEMPGWRVAADTLQEVLP